MAGHWIPLRKAKFLWGEEPEDIVVTTMERGETPLTRELAYSHGACSTNWESSSRERLLAMLSDIILEMVDLRGIDRVAIHKAFFVIPEYAATLPKEHPSYRQLKRDKQPVEAFDDFSLPYLDDLRVQTSAH